MAPKGESSSVSSRTSSSSTAEAMDDARDAKSESLEAITASSVSSEHGPPSDNLSDDDDDDDGPNGVPVSDSHPAADTEMAGQERLGAQGGQEEQEEKEECIDDIAPFDGDERSPIGTTGDGANEGVPRAKPAWGWRIRSLRQQIAIRSVVPGKEEAGKCGSESNPGASPSATLPIESAPILVPEGGPTGISLGDAPFVLSVSESTASPTAELASDERIGTQESEEEQEKEEQRTDDIAPFDGDERSTTFSGDRASEGMPSAKPVWGRRIRSLQQRLASRNRLPEEENPGKSSSNSNCGSSTSPPPTPPPPTTTTATAATKQPVLKALVPTNKKQDLESFRPGTISITVFKEAVDTRLGIGLQVQEEEEVAGQQYQQPQHQSGSTSIGRPQIVEIGYLSRDNDDLLCHSPLQVGDVIKTVNNQECTNLDETRKLLQDVQGQLTLTVKTRRGNPVLVQAMVTKPTVDTMLGLGFFNVPRPRGASLLQINHISPKGLVAHSVLSQGCLVLAINGTPCCHFKEDAAANLIQQAEKHVTIVAMKPTRTRRQGTENGDSTGPTRAQIFFRGAKKAGVAVGGVAMVGVGLVFIPTPLPGEALILGGVSLLGTEFEAPRRVMKNTRDKFARVVREQNDDDDEAPVVSAEDARTVKHSNTFIKRTMTPSESDVSEVSAKSTEDDFKDDNIYTYDYDIDYVHDDDDVDSTEAAVHGVESSVKDRCKRFGRNYILPFLDLAAGDTDRLEGSEQENVAAPRVKLSLKEQIEAELRRHAPTSPTVEQTATSASGVIEAVEEPLAANENP